MDVTLTRPTSLEEAVDLLARHGEEARPIAGGTALVLMLRQRLLAARVLVDLTRVPGLSAVRAQDGGLHLGATALLHDVARSPLVRERCPALARAFGVVGNVRIRHQATVGGNLAEADYASDPPTMLLALGATATVQGPRGRRSLPVEQLILASYTTSLEPGEVVTAVTVPPLPPGARATYLRFTSRSTEDRPCAAVGVVARLEEGVCRELRVAVGAACDVPTRLPEAEALAAGRPLTDEVAAEVAEAYAGGVDALEDLRGSAWYRRRVVRALVRRALAEVRDGRG